MKYLVLALAAVLAVPTDASAFRIFRNNCRNQNQNQNRNVQVRVVNNRDNQNKNVDNRNDNNNNRNVADEQFGEALDRLTEFQLISQAVQPPLPSLPPVPTAEPVAPQLPPPQPAPDNSKVDALEKVIADLQKQIEDLKKPKEVVTPPQPTPPTPDEPVAQSEDKWEYDIEPLNK
jgi:hypothetical protein